MSSSMLVLTVILPAAVATAAAVATVFALRGRRADDHPLCRRCGFDLYGKPEGATVCSECGADLKRPRAVRVGRREKRRRLLGFALPLLFVCVAWLGLLGWGAGRGTNWNKHKPAWWLARDASAADAATRDAALAELVDRVAKGKLPDSRVASLTDAALDHQADCAAPWVQGWGDFIEQARAAGKVPDDKWRRYARQAVQSMFRAHARPKIRRGDPVPIRVLVQVPRGARKLMGTYYIRGAFCEVGGHMIGDTTDNSHGGVKDYPLGTIVMGGSSSSARPDSDVLAKLQDGPQTARAFVDVTVRDPAAPRTAAPLLNERIGVEAPFTLVPADTVTLKLTTDPALREAVRKSIDVQCVFDTTSREGARWAPFVGAQAVHVDFNRPPVPLAFRLYIRSGGKEFEAGRTLLVDAGRFPMGHRIRDGGPETVDVVLRPDPASAYSRVDVHEIWGEELVFKKVPVISHRR